MPEPAAEEELGAFLNSSRQGLWLHKSAAQNKRMRDGCDDHPSPVSTDIGESFRAHLLNRLRWCKVLDKQRLENDPDRFNRGLRILGGHTKLGSNKCLTKNCLCPLAIGIAIGEEIHRFRPSHAVILTSARPVVRNRRTNPPSRDINDDSGPT